MVQGQSEDLIRRRGIIFTLHNAHEMSTDFQMVRTVRRGFTPRLPLTLISLVLEFANFENGKRKRACLWP